MKRTYYLLLTMGIGFLVNGQSHLIYQKKIKTTTVSKKNSKISSNIIFEQKIGDKLMYIPSFYTKSGEEVTSTDDVQFNNSVKVDRIVFIGDTWEAFNLVDSVLGGKFMIFEEENGKPKGKPSNPSTAKIYKEFDKDAIGFTIKQVGETSTIINLDLEALLGSKIELDANKKYFILFSLKQSIDDILSSGITWTRLSSLPTLSDAYVIDEKNLLGVGVTDWTNFVDLVTKLGEDPNSLAESMKGLSMTLYGESNLGVNEIYSNKINYYPNPTSDIIYLNEFEKVLKSEVINQNGQIVTTSSKKEINLKHLPKGVYFLKQYLKDGKIETSKILKK